MHVTSVVRLTYYFSARGIPNKKISVPGWGGGERGGNLVPSMNIHTEYM
jgi:hypothetical protein